eukprot:Blabericola_migrator_1__2990@NODE_1865_length_3631_cov_221_034512_g1194_i0_p1_GENE_NODE_1865_length_3631_cov_221_034512_g1194_i0NODE_1865_length_3631_cov_221_034512_g1194_i0_p1_ORF_typecomplete_len469_score69_55PUB/PF09409_10/1_2e05Stressantifung/PF01657_17/0_23_NODE_1865_length_3631_cov_221_034512_g1194_i01981604
MSDELLVQPLKHLAALQKKTCIYAAHPAVFASLVKRLALEPGQYGIVLDCRSRNQQHVHPDYVQAMGGISMAAKLPRHTSCTPKDKTDFREWLKANTNLKTVLVLSEDTTCDAALHEQSFMGRILKYLGQSQSAPKRVVILADGLINMTRNVSSVVILRMPFPLLAMSPLEVYPLGAYVALTNKFGQTPGVQEAMHHLRVGHVINLTSAKLPSFPNIQVYEFGLTYLPLKTPERAARMYQEILPVIIKACAEKKVVLILDGPSKVLSAVVLALALVEVARRPMSDVLRLLRDRLDPPQFDSYTLAALSHLENRSLPSEQRMRKAIDCLAAKYSPSSASDSDGTARASKKKEKINALLQGTQSLTTRECWERIQEYMEKSPVPPEVLSAVYELISRIFNNVLLHPNEARYKKVLMANPRISHIFESSPVARDLMITGGWLYNAAERSWIFPDNKSYQSLRDVLVYISHT